MLTVDRETNKIKVNLESRVSLLLREADCLLKLKLEIPIVALTILVKRDYFILVHDSLQLLIDELVSTARRVKLEVRPLLLPHLVRVTSLLIPGLKNLTWTNSGWKDFCQNTRDKIKTFDILITRVHDVYANRILQVLAIMQKVTLHALPDDEPWNIDDFLEKNDDACRLAAIDLHRRSLMVEEAVEEVLQLVKNAADDFKNNGEFDHYDFGGNNESNGQSTNEEPTQQQQDWTVVWACFDDPHQLLTTTGGGLSKNMQEMVRNAVSEMRRYYSRKVVDVLIKVTRSSLDAIRKRFVREVDSDILPHPVFLLQATLMIPSVIVKPSLEEVQEALTLAGKAITGVSKGVAQWNAGSNKVLKFILILNL